MIKVAIITVSDSRTEENDVSGKVIKNLLPKDIYEIIKYCVIKDEKREIKNKLINCIDKLNVDLVLTNGGTGFGPRDVTQEATKEIIEKEVQGIPEFIRYECQKKTKRAVLSRAISGIRKNSLIINLPGSPKGAEESLSVIIDLLPHAISMLKGEGH